MMDRVRNISRLRSALLSAWCAGFLLVLTSGCTVLEKCALMLPTEANESVGRVDMLFWSDLSVVDDTQHPGAQIPGLAGRVWLAGQDLKHYVTPNGSIEAEMYDMTPGAANGPAKKIADWKIGARELRMLRREDKVGQGYTLFLPWVDYTPAIKKVQLHLTFVAADGSRHATIPTTMNVRNNRETPQIHVEERLVVPALGTRR